MHRGSLKRPRSSAGFKGVGHQRGSEKKAKKGKKTPQFLVTALGGHPEKGR